MSYVLTDGATTVVTYPYNVGLLRRDNPNTSFPASPDETLLAEWNVFPVVATAAPTYDRLAYDLAEVNPTTSDGGVTWDQAWQLTAVDAATTAARTAEAEAQCADQSTFLLQDAEQYYLEAMIAGAGFHTDMQDYIATISDPSTITGYPLLEDMVWPQVPANVLDPLNPDLPVDIYTKGQAYSKLEVDMIAADLMGRIDALDRGVLIATRDGQQINVMDGAHLMVGTRTHGEIDLLG